jgi:hypothetical protein
MVRRGLSLFDAVTHLDGDAFHGAVSMSCDDRVHFHGLERDDGIACFHCGARWSVDGDDLSGERRDVRHRPPRLRLDSVLPRPEPPRAERPME